MPIEDLLVPGRVRNRGHLKKRLIAAGMLAEHCAACGLRSWLDRPLSLALHHINGDRHDNRLENLQLLCPNCHSQTDTFSGRSSHRRRQRAA
jgi:5-methylcytosine-specific restriction endonuclease McrA